MYLFRLVSVEHQENFPTPHFVQLQGATSEDCRRFTGVMCLEVGWWSWTKVQTPVTQDLVKRVDPGPGGRGTVHILGRISLVVFFRSSLHSILSSFVLVWCQLFILQFDSERGLALNVYVVFNWWFCKLQCWIHIFVNWNDRYAWLSVSRGIMPIVINFG